ncbi:MAG: metallophosphoesterase [Hyphomicrobiaceae bacterium]
MNIQIPDYSIVLLYGSDDEILTQFALNAFGCVTNLGGALRTAKETKAAFADIERRLRERQIVIAIIGSTAEEILDDLIDMGDRYHAQVIGLQVARLHKASALSPRNTKRLAAIHHIDLRASSRSRNLNVETVPFKSDKRTLTGSFDIIGDVHGCFHELLELLRLLGYRVDVQGKGSSRLTKVVRPANRRVIFVGDLVDRGPASPDVLRLVMEMIAQDAAMCVIGNHDNKLLRWLSGSKVSLTHGLETTVDQIMLETAEFRNSVREFLYDLPYQLWLDGGQLVIAHAGIREEMIGRESRKVRDFCLYGDSSGQRNELGLPIRYHWALRYNGDPAIIYGHTPVSETSWINNTLCIDTGCVFGGQLTALQWPERYLVSVAAHREYRRRPRPFGHPPPRPCIDN